MSIFSEMTVGHRGPPSEMPGARSRKPPCARVQFAGLDVVPGAAHCLHGGCRARTARSSRRLWQGSEQGPPTCLVFPISHSCSQFVRPLRRPESMLCEEPFWLAALVAQTPSCPRSRAEMILPCVFSRVAMKVQQPPGCQTEPSTSLRTSLFAEQSALIAEHHPSPRGAPAAPPAAVLLQKPT